jgi:hypothetical protein
MSEELFSRFQGFRKARDKHSYKYRVYLKVDERPSFLESFSTLVEAKDYISTFGSLFPSWSVFYIIDKGGILGSYKLTEDGLHELPGRVFLTRGDLESLEETLEDSEELRRAKGALRKLELGRGGL